ncbi:MAG TPA: hypothetical protein VMF12_04535 [Xanthobacteraceae bacterium]|nr:hypothetical protein [Xanthobacteraceae bacterium]
MSMCTEIHGSAVSVHYAIPTGFVAQVLTLKPGTKPPDQPSVGNQMFAVTSATGSESRQWLKSSGLLTIRPGRVPSLSAYAYQSSVSLLLAYLAVTDFAADAWAILRGRLPPDAGLPLLLAARDAAFRIDVRIIEAMRRAGLSAEAAWLLDLAHMATTGRIAMLDSWRGHLQGSPLSFRPFGEDTDYARSMRLSPDHLARVIVLVEDGAPTSTRTPAAATRAAPR